MQDLVLLPVGVIVGITNALAGGGSLLSFPVFLALGYSPFSANVTNSVGVLASNIGAMWGYHAYLRSNVGTATKFALVGAAGSVVGAELLLSGGEKSFGRIVPWLIGAGTVLVLVQPLVARAVANHLRTTNLIADSISESESRTPAHANKNVSVFALVCAGALAIYCGYFGVAMGVMFLGVIGLATTMSLQAINAHKIAFTASANLVCAVLFLAFANVAIAAALYMGAGCLVGGVVGSRIASRMSDKFLRPVIAMIGLVAVVMTLFS